ncbi:putative metal-binding motif-containing protein [Archangium violaceum]|uniref:putative metal-binding motif-containing protein n=1 Tax=Archangium violaceum TaxID=83451 RepID=UPI001951D1CF|nr:putative metal-binding motif-containing protein [Archangium violaceum]QRN96612.1 putative metal-binding motif-containing protein [Archangium violaceum]
MPSTDRLVRLSLLALGACVALAIACYEVPRVDGYYSCNADAECGDGGFVCDDGVCCREQEDPLCIGRVLDGGTCLDGGTPMTFFEDLDEDGFGNLTQPLYRCSPPQSVPTVTNSDDCNDNPAAGGRLFFPNAPEQCDGLDNSCDGVIDEGLDGGRYYRDQDNDGFGDPAQPGTFCQKPVGWADNAQDCRVDNGAVHPGALEVCNGLDDDCNLQTDDIPELNQPCVDSSRLGVCAEGRRACVGGKDTCRQLVNPASQDTCNAKDDDCDGVTDERPDCGGPTRFFADSTVVVGARHLNSALNGVVGGCLKDNTAYTNASPADTVSGDVWSGSDQYSHVFWAERDGGTWDLTRPQTTLKLWATFTSSGGTYSNPDGGLNRWASHSQPVVLLCGPGGFLRLVHPAPLLNSAGTVSITQSIPLPPPDGGAWVIGANSTSDVQGVLRQVKRVEVLVQPAATSTTGTAVGFKADFHPDFGLP